MPSCHVERSETSLIYYFHALPKKQLEILREACPERSRRAENDIAPERHWFFPAEECRWVALRRRAALSSATNPRISRIFRRQKKIRTACRNESPGGSPR